MRTRLAAGLSALLLLTSCGGPAPPPSSDRAHPTVGAVTPEPAAPLVVATHVTRVTDAHGAAIIQGLVENRAATPAGAITIVVTVLDARGAVVGTMQASPLPALLQPAARAPWRVTADPGTAVADLAVRVAAQPAGGLDYAVSYTDLTAEGVRVVGAPGDGDGSAISGEVVNTGNLAASGVRVTVVGHAPDGGLLVSEPAFVGRNELEPGQRAPFAVRLVAGRDGSAITGVEVFLEGAPRKPCTC